MGESDASNRLTARPIQKTEFVGNGCLIQGLGIVLGVALAFLMPLGWLFGLLVAIGMFIAGSRISIVWVCGNCRNKLDSQDVRICPTCKAEISR